MKFRAWKAKHKKARLHLSRETGRKTMCGRPIPKPWDEVMEEDPNQTCAACMEAIARLQGTDEEDSFGRFYEGAEL